MSFVHTDLEGLAYVSYMPSPLDLTLFPLSLGSLSSEGRYLIDSHLGLSVPRSV